MKKFSFKLVLASILIITISNTVTAQTFLFENIPNGKTQLGLRFMRPTLSSDADLSTLSGIYDLTVSVPVGADWSIAGSLPFITSAFEDQEADNGIANIYVGAQDFNSIDEQQSTIVSFGLYLPTAAEDIGGFGIFTNFEDFYKYVSDVLTITGNFAYFNLIPGGARFGLEIGPDIMIPTNDENEADTELFLHYGLTAGFQAENFSIITELIGLVIVTEEADDFGDRFEHSLNFGASYISKNVTPGIFYKLYLSEDLSDVIDGVLGINIEVTLN